MTAKSLVSILVVLLLALIAAFAHGSPIWPHPMEENINTAKFTTFSSRPLISQLDDPIYKKAVDRYLKYIFGEDAERSVSGSVTTWNILIHRLGTPLNLNTDESYSLTVSENSVTLNAKEVWGALRGLESLSQLISKNDQGKYVSNLAAINDKPRYQWRGLMIDVARHFITPRTLKRMIDGMSFNKFNVLHLHLTDAESFPFVVEANPKLSEKGAWHKSLVYSPEILKDIVNYSKERGIRVVPEIDIPGHTYSWGKAYPEALANCTQLLERTKNINNAALNIAKDFTFDLIRQIIDQLSEIFGDEYLHLGGDEVVTGCWKEDTSITAYMNAHNMKNYQDLEGDFSRRVENFYRAKGKKLVSWQELSEIKTNFWKYPSDGVIQVWKEAQDLPKYVGGGNKLILSGGWYLDKAAPDSTQAPPYLFGDNWKNMYEIDPARYLNAQQAKQVIGGEACQFGEQIDEFHLEGRIWPRASAVAERLWSPASVNNTATAQERLIKHRCEVLVKRGIKATPLRPDFCRYTWDL